MESPPRAGRAVDLRAVRVRPTHGASGHRLVASHHCLPFGGLFGKGLQQVATLGPTWVALVGWQAAALKLAARDRWVGWSPAQKRRRLHLVLRNSRFVALPGGHCKNLASRVLGLSLRRLAGGTRLPRLARRNVHRPGALCRHLLPGRQLALAGPHPRLRAPAGSGDDLAPPRSAQGDSRV